jgi:hypothetical protein
MMDLDYRKAINPKNRPKRIGNSQKIGRQETEWQKVARRGIKAQHGISPLSAAAYQASPPAGCCRPGTA